MHERTYIEEEYYPTYHNLLDRGRRFSLAWELRLAETVSYPKAGWHVDLQEIVE
jgi:hypothetical protein